MSKKRKHEENITNIDNSITKNEICSENGLKIEFESMNESNFLEFRSINSIVLPINHPKQFYQSLLKSVDKDKCLLGIVIYVLFCVVLFFKI